MSMELFTPPSLVPGDHQLSMTASFQHDAV